MRLHRMGYSAIAGVDEAGRGALAGPVFAAAVILPLGVEIDGLDDSKQLSATRRESLHEEVREQCEAWAVARASSDEISSHNVLGASLLAMRRAVEKLDPPADFALIDGDQKPDLEIPAQALVKGDSASPSIAAASILAKVERDRLMEQLSERFPEYRLAANKGYGTRDHKQALERHGPSPVHRLSFAGVSQRRLFSE